MKSFLLVVLSMAVYSGFASAAETKCSSADHRIEYNSKGPDGGPNIGPTTYLKLDGKTLIAHSPRGGAELRSASMQWLGKQTKVKEDKEINYDVLYYVQELAVTSLGSAPPKSLYVNILLCRATKYTGPPIP